MTASIASPGTGLTFIVSGEPGITDDFVFHTYKGLRDWFNGFDPAAYQQRTMYVTAVAAAPPSLHVQNGYYETLADPFDGWLMVAGGKVLLCAQGIGLILVETAIDKLFKLYQRRYTKADITVRWGDESASFGSRIELELWLKREGSEVVYDGITYVVPTILPDGSYTYVMPMSGCTLTASDGMLTIVVNGASAYGVLVAAQQLHERITQLVEITVRDADGNILHTDSYLYRLDAWLNGDGKTAAVHSIQYTLSDQLPVVLLRRELEIEGGTVSLTEQQCKLMITATGGEPRSALGFMLNWRDLLRDSYGNDRTDEEE